MAEEKQSYYDLLKEAKQAEANNNLETATNLYQKALDEDAFDVHVYDRLMILYRKQKMYGDELKTINKAIKSLANCMNKNKKNQAIKR